jgi:outer membrane protein insertion porin family
VVVTVAERPAGSFSVGRGYSEIQGLIYSLRVLQDSFLGTGTRVGAGVSYSDIIKNISLSFEDPYWTDDGISRGFYARYSEFDRQAANISTFTSSEAAAGMSLGVPLTEIDYLRGSVGVRFTDINIGTPQIAGEYPTSIDPPMSVCRPDTSIMPPGCPTGFIFFTPIAGDPLSNALDHNVDGILSSSEREFDTYEISLAWSRDSRNHFLNPTQGSSQRLTLEASVPGSSREFYKLFYRYAKYLPLTRSLTFSYHGDIGYGDAYDGYDDSYESPNGPPFQDTTIRPGFNCLQEEVIALDTGLPFYEHFYGGGVRDIRGFDDNTLGPKDTFCRALGGDFKVSGGIEVAIPTPFTQGSGSRIALFIDIGNVYENIDAFDASLLRASAGLSVTWQAPIGPIIMNFAVPLKEEEGDRTESIQFSFGTTF